MSIDPVFFLALTQLILEALPISSSGHVRLVQALCARWGIAVMLPESIDHLLHGPALLMVAVYFRSEWWSLLRNIGSAGAAFLSRNYVRDSQRNLLRICAKLCGMIAVADGITVCLYWLIKVQLAHVVAHNSLVLLACGFCITALLLLSERWLVLRAYVPLNYTRAATIGFVQGIIFLLPGVSRFAVTVMVAQWLGLSPQRALQTSFLFFAPIMLLAFVGHGLPELLTGTFWAMLSVPLIAVLSGAMVLSYVLFVVACRATVRRRLWLFGVYMILPIICALWLALF